MAINYKNQGYDLATTALTTVLTISASTVAIIKCGSSGSSFLLRGARCFLAGSFFDDLRAGFSGIPAAKAASLQTQASREKKPQSYVDEIARRAESRGSSFTHKDFRRCHPVSATPICPALFEYQVRTPDPMLNAI